MVDDPTQIKSATDNIGTFDRTNPDIRYSRVGESFASLMEQMEEKIKQYGGMELPGREIEVPGGIDAAQRPEDQSERGRERRQPPRDRRGGLQPQADELR